ERPVHARLGASPRWAERRRLRMAAKARAITGALCRRCTWKELHIACQWRANPAHRATIDACGLDRHKHEPGQGWVALLHGGIMSVEVEHAGAIPRSQR